MNRLTGAPLSSLRPGADHGGFIPSLEGMRALAVVVAVLFHLGVPGAGGGYLGIELFFVISGYIITRNILFDLRTDKFSLSRFYVRRVRRLLPVMLVTVLLTLLLAIVWVPPDELEKTARSAFFAVVSFANFNFWYEAGYFDAEAHYKPLLHTWSLSVEEQFYLLWPALLVALGTKTRRLVCTALLIVLSLGAAMFYRDSMPEAVFYLLPFRVYELMSGALVAILALRLMGFWGNLSALVGFGGFLVATVMVTDEYTPALTAASVCGLSLLMLLGRETQVANFLLSNKPMQWIGARSYSIYLVHWPIFVLYKYLTDFEPSLPERAMLSAISLLVAAAAYELVEKPFRLKGEQTAIIQRLAWPAIAVTLMLASVISLAIWQMKGLPSRFDSRMQHIVDSLDEENLLRRKAIRWGTCNLHEMHHIEDYDVEKCASLDATRPNALVIGDSLAADTYMMLTQSYPQIHFLQATGGGCTAVMDTNFLGKRYPTCLAMNALRFEKLAKLDVDLIVLASTWTLDRIPALIDTVAYLRSLGKRVLVIGPRAVFTEPLPLQISKQATLDGINQRLQEKIDRKEPLLQAMRARLPDVEIVDMASIQCSPLCDVLEDEHLLYFDRIHFTRLGATRFGERFRRAFDLPGFLANPQIR